MPERLTYSVQETADLLGVHRDYVRWMIRNGDLRAIRPSPKKTLVLATSLETLLGSPAQAPAPALESAGGMDGSGGRSGDACGDLSGRNFPTRSSAIERDSF